MKIHRYSQLAGIAVATFFLYSSGTQPLARGPADSDQEACASQSRAYDEAAQAEEFAQRRKESAILMLIGAVVGGAILGSWLNAKLDVRRRAVPHAIAGGLACAVGGITGGICAIGILGNTPSKTRHKLLHIGSLLAILWALHSLLGLRPPTNEILTTNQEFTEKQQETAEAFLLLENCLDKHSRLSR